MAQPSNFPSVDRRVLRLVDSSAHHDQHDARLLDYWRAQPVESRLAAAQRARQRVHGLLPPLDRTAFRLIERHSAERPRP
jgi:hypothetical protein